MAKSPMFKMKDGDQSTSRTQCKASHYSCVWDLCVGYRYMCVEASCQRLVTSSAALHFTFFEIGSLIERGAH